MKKVFLLFGIAAFTSASAQEKGVFDINRHIQEVLKNKSAPGIGVKNYTAHKVFIHSQSKLSHVLANGDKVYILSGDNMPCIVPDMRQFNTMPNISNPNEYFESLYFRQHVAGSIPNAVKPYRVIVSE